MSLKVSEWSRHDAPKTQQPLAGPDINFGNSHTPRYGILTLSRLDISSVRQIPLDADDDVFETWEMDGCRDVIRDTPFEQNRRVCSELWVCGQCSDEGGSIVIPLGVRDNVSGPSQSKRHRR